MTILIIVTALLAMALPALANDDSAGKISLERLVRYSGFCELDPHYSGTLTLAYPKSEATAQDDSREIVINCMAYNSCDYSSPDEPQPKLLGLFHRNGSAEKGWDVYMDFFFLDPAVPSVSDLQAASSVTALRKLVPRLIASHSEEEVQHDPAQYYYSWSYLTGGGKLEVMRIVALCPRKDKSWKADESAPLKSILIWTGTLKPTGPNKEVQSTPLRGATDHGR